MIILKKLTKKKTLTILGINSGTSADGIDLALIKFSSTGRKPRIDIIGGDVVAYPRTVKRELERFLVDPVVGKEALCRFDLSYGQFLGQAAAKFMHSLKIKVDLIGSHGQTIGHFPQKKKSIATRHSATMQIGDGHGIASTANLPVVTDFRSADVSLGGEGAPLTPFVNALLFADTRQSRIIVNIGGIANYSFVPASNQTGKISGADCGPGNIISDRICHLLFHQPFDKSGELASQGTPRPELIQLLKKASQIKSKSLGREQFGVDLIARLIHLSRKKRYYAKDILASAMKATAQLIGRSIKPHLDEKNLDAIYLTGGGRRNMALVKMLSDQIKGVKIWPIEKLGCDGDLLEAASFAVLAGCFINGIGSTLTQVTGAKMNGIAGRLSLPPGR